MTDTLIRIGNLNDPNYIYSGATGIGSTGCAGMTGATVVGDKVFSVVDKNTYIINPDLSLTPYVLPVEITVGNSIVIGQVGINQPVADAIEIEPGYNTQAVHVPGTPEALVGTPTPVLSILVFPKSGNSGNVYLGTSAVQHTTSKQIIITPTTSYVAFEAPTGYNIDINDLFIDVDTADDGVYFMYLA